MLQPPLHSIALACGPRQSCPDAPTATPTRSGAPSMAWRAGHGASC